MSNALPTPDPAVEQAVAAAAKNGSLVKYDTQGRAYTILADGSKSYVPPGNATTGGTGPKDGAFTNYTWNYKTGQFEKHLDVGSLVGLGVMGGVPALSLAGAFGGGAAALGGAGGGGGAAATGAAGAGTGAAVGTGGTVAAGSGGTVGAINTAMSLWDKIKGFLPAAGNVGQVASGQAGALAQQQEAQDRQRTVRDALALQDAKFTQDNGLARTKQVAYGDALNNVQDVGVDFQPKSGTLPSFNITGGLRPSLFGPNAKQAGSELSRQALLALMSGSDVPKMSTPQPAGALQNTLGTIGTIGALGGAAGVGLPNSGASSGGTPSSSGGTNVISGPGADGLPPLDPNAPMPTMTSGMTADQYRQWLQSVGEQ